MPNGNRTTWAASFLAALLALGALYRVGTAGPRSAGTDSVGMDVYRDPETGEFTTPPPGDTAGSDARPVERPAAMVERQGVTAGGGVLLDGAPMHGMDATVDAGGRVGARCGQ